MAKYRTLLMKNMTFDGPTNDKAKANFELLYDVQIFIKACFHSIVIASSLQPD
jgi:hypothetical protein